MIQNMIKANIEDTLTTYVGFPDTLDTWNKIDDELRQFMDDLVYLDVVDTYELEVGSDQLIGSSSSNIYVELSCEIPQGLNSPTLSFVTRATLDSTSGVEDPIDAYNRAMTVIS